MKNRILVAICFAALAGCSAQPSAPTVAGGVAVAQGTPQALWAKRQAHFNSVAAWQLTGRVGVQFREESATFGLVWAQHDNNNFEMNIKNPLTGAVMALINGGANEVTLNTNNQVYRDKSAEQLVQKQLGVSLPISGMKYWVRGIPAPNAPVQSVKLDAYGRPEVLQQSGWMIEYPEWDGNSTTALPDKIQLKRAAENTKVKVVANDWQTRR